VPSLTHLAIDDHGPFPERVEVIPERVDRHVDRSCDRAGSMFFSGTHVESIHPLLDERVDLVWVHHVAVAAQNVLRHVAEKVDRVLGRGERWCVRELEVCETIAVMPADIAVAITSILLSTPFRADNLGTEDRSVVRVEDELGSHAGRAGVVGRMVEGVRVDCSDGRPAARRRRSLSRPSRQRHRRPSRWQSRAMRRRATAVRRCGRRPDDPGDLATFANAMREVACDTASGFSTASPTA